MTPQKESSRRKSHAETSNVRYESPSKLYQDLRNTPLYQEIRTGSTKKSTKNQTETQLQEPTAYYQHTPNQEETYHQTPLKKKDQLKQKLQGIRNKFGSEEKIRSSENKNNHYSQKGPRYSQERQPQRQNEIHQMQGNEHLIETPRTGRNYYIIEELTRSSEKKQPEYGRGKPSSPRPPIAEIQTEDDDMDLSLATAPTMYSTETDTTFRTVGRLGEHYRSKREFIEDDEGDESSLQHSLAETEFTMMRKTREACLDPEADSTFSILRKTIGTMPGQYMPTVKKIKSKDDCDSSQDSAFKSKLKEQLESKRSASISNSISYDEEPISSERHDSQRFHSQNDIYQGTSGKMVPQSYEDQNQSCDHSHSTRDTLETRDTRDTLSTNSSRSRFERLQHIRNGESWFDDESEAGSAASIEKKKMLGRRSISRRKEHSRSAEKRRVDTPPPPPPPGPPPPRNKKAHARDPSPQIRRRRINNQDKDIRPMSDQEPEKNVSMHSSPVMSIDRRRGVVEPKNSHYLQQTDSLLKKGDDRKQEERQKLTDLRSGKLSSPNPRARQDHTTSERTKGAQLAGSKGREDQQSGTMRSELSQKAHEILDKRKNKTFTNEKEQNRRSSTGNGDEETPKRKNANNKAQESKTSTTEIEENLRSSMGKTVDEPLKWKSANNAAQKKQVSSKMSLAKTKERDSADVDTYNGAGGGTSSSNSKNNSGVESSNKKIGGVQGSSQGRSDGKTQNRGGDNRKKREKTELRSPRLGAKRAATPKRRSSSSKKQVGSETIESPTVRGDLKNKVMVGQFPNYIANPFDEQKSCARLEGYIVWCSHGFHKPVPGFSWTAPTKMFDTIFPTVDEANLRAKYLFHWKNAFGIDEDTMLELYDSGESVKRKCKTFHCTPTEGGRTWKVSVVPAEMFEWMDHVDFNRHPFDDMDVEGSTIM